MGSYESGPAKDPEDAADGLAIPCRALNTSPDRQRERYPARWYAWHSLRSMEFDGIFGEGDFVIVDPGRGLLAVEVKAAVPAKNSISTVIRVAARIAIELMRVSSTTCTIRTAKRSPLVET